MESDNIREILGAPYIIRSDGTYKCDCHYRGFRLININRHIKCATHYKYIQSRQVPLLELIEQENILPVCTPDISNLLREAINVSNIKVFSCIFNILNVNPNYIICDVPILLRAIVLGSASIVEFLIQMGADINARDTIASNVAILATTRADPNIIRIIMKHNPDIYHRNARGFCAIDIAVNKHVVDLVVPTEPERECDICCELKQRMWICRRCANTYCIECHYNMESSKCPFCRYC